MLKKLIFDIKGIHDSNSCRVWVDGKELTPEESFRYRRHSPDGFNWGYGGSGPAQTALAICLEIFKNPTIAQAVYQNFKFSFVGKWPQGENFQVQINLADFILDNREALKEVNFMAGETN